MIDDGSIVISRIFSATSEQVWQAWTDPAQVKEWWGPEGFTAPSIKIDLRVGGKYIFAMHGPAGSEWDKDMYSSGVYQEIVPSQKLVVTDYFSDSNGNLLEPSTYGQDENFPSIQTVTVLFEAAGAGKTKLSICYPSPKNPKTAAALQKSGMVEGWNSSLNKLQLFLERK